MAARTAVLVVLVAAVTRGGLVAVALPDDDRQPGDAAADADVPKTALRAQPRRTAELVVSELPGQLSRSLAGLFIPQCWVPAGNEFNFDTSPMRNECDAMRPVQVCILAFLAAVTTLLLHRRRQQFRKDRRAKRLDKATSNPGRCPAGHGLQRIRWHGGRGHCSNCYAENKDGEAKHLEYMWACREDKWGLCHDCYLEQIANRVILNIGLDDDQSYLVHGIESLSDQHYRPEVSIEVTMTLEIVAKEGSNISSWLEQQIREKAQAAGIPESLIPKLEENVQVFDSAKNRYASSEELEGQLTEDKFPILFKYSCVLPS